MKVGDLVRYTSGYVQRLGILLRVDGMNALWSDIEGDNQWTHIWNLEAISESR